VKVEIHKLFEYLLETTAAEPPECFIGFSLSRSPVLGDFLGDLDPGLSLDWNGQSFQGLPALRQRVIDQAGLSGSCTPDDVLITAGAAEANYLAFRQILSAGDEMVTDAPGWPQAGVMVRAIGATLREVTRREDSGWHLDPDDLARIVTDKTRLIFLSNPNNPTGRLIPADDLSRIVQIADSVGAYLLVDEVYAGLEWSGPRPPSVAGMYARGITTGSVSKALGLQGLRTGWMISPDRGVIRDAMILRENASEIMNVLGEHIAEIALRPDRLAAALTTAQGEARVALDLLDAYVANAAELSWTRPQAGLIGMARLDRIAAEPFARRLLSPPFRTFVLPGTAYGLPRHVRVGVGGGPGVNLAEGLHRFTACLASFSKADAQSP
jgi:aspartate/methionine/tyrosine aminotransferase